MTEVQEKPVENVESGGSDQPTHDEICQDPSKEQCPPIDPALDQALTGEAQDKQKLFAGAFSTGARDGSFSFSPETNASTLMNAYADASLGNLSDRLPQTGKRVAAGGDLTNAAPPVTDAVRTTDAGGERRLEGAVPFGVAADQAHLHAWIRHQNYENPARTQETISGPRGLETRLGRSLHTPEDAAREEATFRANMANMTPEQRERAQAALDFFKDRNLSDAQKAGTLAALNDMMDPKNKAALDAKGITTAQLNDNVVSALENLANPGTIRQGQNQSCALDGPTKELVASNPAAAADLIRQMHVNTETAPNGNTLVTLPDGSKVQVDSSFVKHDNESLSAKTQQGALAGQRDVFNRSMNLLMGNAVSQNEYGMFYVDRNSTGRGDTGERMIRMDDPNGFRSTNYATYGSQDSTQMFVRAAAARGENAQAKANEVITDPLMTNSAAIRLQGFMGLGDQLYNGNRTGTRPGLSTSGDVRTVDQFEAARDRNGGYAVVSLDSRHALFTQFGQREGYGGGHTVFSFGKMPDGRELVGTWGQLQAVKTSDLVNSMAPREQHRPLNAADYPNQPAPGPGGYGPRPGEAPGTGGGGRPVDGREQSGGQHRDTANIADQDARRRAEQDERNQRQREQDDKERQELEAKEKRTKEEEARLAEIRKRQELDRQRNRKYYQPTG